MRKFAYTLGLFLISTRLHANLVRSDQDLKFYEITSFDRPSRYLGFTSSKLENVVEVPSADRWYLRPDRSMSQEDYQKLFQEVREKKYPGLDLSDRWDVADQTLQGLSDAKELKILRLASTKITDKGLTVIASLPSLEVLALNNQTSDAGLKQLKSLHHLKVLELHHAKITDSGLAALKTHEHLKVLDLSDCRITDAGAKELATFTSLEQLDISGTEITDKGFAKLETLPHLEVLYATGRLTDKGLASVARMKNLRSLDLSGTAITSEGLRALEEAKHLEALALSDTRITDRGMEALYTLRKLKTLELSGTRVTREGLSSLVGLKRLETLSVSWTELSTAELAVLYEIMSLKSVILSGRTVDRETLSRIRALAKRTHIHSQPKTTIAKKTSPVFAPVSHPAVHTESTKTTLVSHGKLTPMRPASLTTPSLPLGHSLSATEPGRIAIGEEQQGEGIVIEVKTGRIGSSGSNPKRVRGLKGLHQLEMAEAPPELQLQEGAQPVIHSGEDDPKNSLGEINVNIR